jgi:hypothetical protein
MKNRIYILAASLFTLASTSCTKVIDLKLKNGDPLFVIEGNFSDDTLGNEIRISKSVPFNQTNTFPSVTNAIVTLIDASGNVETLAHSQNGIYPIKTTLANYGSKYKLNINVDGKTFTSESTMPYPTKLDSIDFLTFSFGANDNINVVPMYQDSVGIKNFYRFVVSSNDSVSNDIFVTDDVLADGLISGQPYFGDYELKKNDTAKIEMQCIDKNVYLYFFSLDQNSNGGAAPANPVSNITGGALGYFNAHTVSRKARIVQ